MVSPDKVAALASLKEDENYAFRTYLKDESDPDELDQQFLQLHNLLFADFDCSSCRNCCKAYQGVLDEDDLPACAEALGMSVEDFTETYLNRDRFGNWETKHRPCDFLQGDGSCLLGDHKPQNCVLYPYTNQPDRWGSLYGVVENASVCPVVYEILERLKKLYGFRYRKRSRHS